MHGGHDLQARWYIFAVIGLALLVDLSRITVSLRSARMYRSAALRSNAFHFAGDTAGSLAVLGGMAAVAAGFEEGDAVAALVVAAIIFLAASRLIYENARVLMDTAPGDAQARAEAAIHRLGDAIELRRLRLRESGARMSSSSRLASSWASGSDISGGTTAVTKTTRPPMACSRRSSRGGRGACQRDLRFEPIAA